MELMKDQVEVQNIYSTTSQPTHFNAIHNNNFITSNFHHHYQYITNSSALTSIHVHNNCPFHIRSPHASSPIPYL
ncbi:hypothetical protein YC2023_082585 [Brassica napus]